MPKRFRSLRGRQADLKTNVVDPPEYFDHDFRAGSFSIPHQQPAHARPKTAGGYRTVPREATEDRPRTADRPVDKRLETTKVESSYIGLAIGSPTHTPTAWSDHLSPTSPQHAFRNEGPFPAQQNSSWKKIGGMFKPRTSSLKQVRSPATCTEPTPSPLSRTITDHHHEQSSLQHPDEAVVVKPSPPPKTPIGPVDKEKPSPPLPQNCLPKLEIEIPRFEFDRYSVMFKDIMGSTASKHVPRTIKIVNDPRVTDINPEGSTQPLPSPRRVTNPSLSKFQYSPFPPSVHPLKQNPSHSTLSLTDLELRRRSVSSPTLPVKMTHLNNIHIGRDQVEPSRALPRRPQLTMPATDPGEPGPEIVEVAELPSTMSPVPRNTSNSKIASKMKSMHRRTETANSAKPKPLVTRRAASGDMQSSPEDGGTSEMEDAPWRSTDSLSSSISSNTSVEEEIFFDLKPFRDSKGIRNSQYVVTNPDASAVELARTMSQKNRKKLHGNGISPEAQGYNWTPEMLSEPWDMPPDLQAAEHFCMSSDMQAAQPILRLSMFDKAIEEVEKFASPSEHNRSSPARQINHTIRHMRVPSRSKGLAIGIPSPIAERSCEGTPIVENTPRISRPKRHIAAQATASPTIIVSALSSNFDTPPPVPRKDSKFLPKARPVMKSTTPRPSSRTDRASMHKKVPRKPVTDRYVPDQRTKAYEYKEQPTARRHAPGQKSKTSTASSSRPRLEVSVARTVSLTRKPSHKVFVMRQGGSDSTLLQNGRA